MHARVGVFVCVCLCVCVSECVRGGVACACKNKQKQESKEEEGRDLATWVTHPSLSALSLPRPPLPPLPPLPGPLLWKPHQKQAPPPSACHPAHRRRRRTSLRRTDPARPPKSGPTRRRARCVFACDFSFPGGAVVSRWIGGRLSQPPRPAQPPPHVPRPPVPHPIGQQGAFLTGPRRETIVPPVPVLARPR